MSKNQEIFADQELQIQESPSSCSLNCLFRRREICAPPTQFSRLGLLFPIYFYWVILVGGIMLLQCLFAVGTMLYNLQGTNCEGYTSFICRLSIVNIIHDQNPGSKEIEMQTGNNFMQILSMVIYFEFMIFMLKKKVNHLNKTYVSQSKYALLVKHIKGADQAVYLNTIKIVEDQYFDTVGVRNPVIKYYPIVPKRWGESDFDIDAEGGGGFVECIGRVDSQVRGVIKVQKAVVSKVILIFRFPVRTSDFQNQHLEEVVDPTDVMWENIAVLKEQSRNVLMIIGTFAVMVMCFFIILLIKQMIKRNEVGENSTLVFMSNLGVATVAALFNSLEGIVIRKSAREERYSDHSKFFKIVAKRLSVLFFLNMVISTFMANLFIMVMKNKDDRWVPIDYKGLVTDFFFLFITNSYLSSIFNLFDIFYGLKLLKRLKLKHFPERCNYSEEETREIMAGHPVDMGLRYANIMKSLFFTSAIAPFVPIGAVFSLVGIMISYWVDKYLLIERYVASHKLSSEFGKSMVEFSKYSVILLSISNFVLQIVKIDRGSNTEVPTFNYYSDFYLSMSFIVLAVIYKFFWESIKRAIYPKIMKINFQLSYETVQSSFEHTYAEWLQGVTREVAEEKPQEVLELKLETEPVPNEEG